LGVLLLREERGGEEKMTGKGKEGIKGEKKGGHEMGKKIRRKERRAPS